jgi:antitoxin component of MazEF toxin-antitoxin module
MTLPPNKTTPRSTFDDLLEAFEKMSPEERQRDIEQANAFFRENGIDTLAKFDEWARQ